MSSLHTHRQGSCSEVGTTCSGKRFADPDMFYAPHAFWFWNGPEELANPSWFGRMAAGMAQQGLNPGYVHARHYKAHESFWLSDAWYAAFGAAVASTEASGACMSYTMGDPCFPDKYLLPDHPEFPDFPVGGISLSGHPELKAESLGWTCLDATGGNTVAVPASLFAVAAEFDDSHRMLSSSLEVIGAGNAFEWWVPGNGRWRIYVFTKYRQASGQYRINFLDRRITEPWLKLENSKYEELFSDRFGGTMRCVFFDLEGKFGYKLVWSENLAADYRERKGADIRRLMPLLIEEDVEGLWPKARHDWFDVVGSVYTECLFAPLDRWCRERGMLMTCHFWEERLFKQAVHVGSFMGAQRSYSMPGIDTLFLSVHDPRVHKETQSVCEFEGRPFMNEVFGVAGWGMTPVELKQGANAAIANGNTHLILHGVNSSPKLEKVAYPPDFFHWNPYWRHFHVWSDFVRRGCYVNDHGRLDAQTLLFCPMDSVWSLMGDDYFDREKPQPRDVSDRIDAAKGFEMAHISEIQVIDEVYDRAIREMSAARIDYLVADSHYLKGMCPGAETTLSYGAFAFRTLVLPQLKLLPLEVARRITDFANAGGRIYALGSLADASAEHGLGDPELRRLMDELRQAPSFVAAPEGIAALVARGVPGLDACVEFESGMFPLLATRRTVNGQAFVWLANNDDEQHAFTLRIRHVSGEASLWNCEDGSRRPVRVEALPGGSARVRLILESYEGAWLVFGAAQPLSPTAPVSYGQRQALQMLAGDWTVSVDATDQPDTAQHKLMAPEWLLSGGQRRPLESWLKWDLRQFSGFVDYEKDIVMESVSGREVLDLGTVKHFAEVWINGVSAGARLWAPFCFAIGRLLKPGRNNIRIKAGNTILNAMTQYEGYNLKWHKPPTDAQLESGVFGPVTICRGVSR